MKNILLPHCWVCQVRFNNQVPPGPAMEERHHIMPRAFGGTDGPVVSLCDRHHTMLHKVAVCLRGKKVYQYLLTGESTENRKKVLWLASKVLESEALAKDDPNKPMKLFLLLSPEQKRKFNTIKARLQRNQKETAELLIDFALNNF